MIVQNLQKLAALIIRERTALIAQWRHQLRQLPSAQYLDTPTLNDHIPAFLDELAAAFQQVSDQTISAAVLCEGSAPNHGLQRYQDGFDLVEVVAEYNILRGCIHDLAEQNALALQGQAFHILNRVLDQAIGLAVDTFAKQRALEVQRRREEYLAFVAHDLRTPLNAISLSARVLELAHTNTDTKVDVAQMLKALRRNVKHLEALVDKVLKENAHMENDSGVQLQRREFDLWPLVEALIHDLQPMASTAHTQLINEVPEELSVYADASVLRRVLQNLVANALKYTPHGQIVIAAQIDPQTQVVECSVGDNGAGIAADRLATLFDKVESDASQSEVSGLGLAIVKTFVEAHGGAVAVESAEGVGSTFRFTLPGRDGATA